MPKSLPRTLSLPVLVLSGTGMIIGAGIYSIIGKAAGAAGDSLWISFLLASVSVFFTALSYAELSAMYPHAGADYIYVKSAFSRHRWIARTAGLQMAFASLATAATVAVAFGGYLQDVLPGSPLLFALLLIVACTAVNLVGMREAGWIMVAFTLLEVGGLLLLVGLGIQAPHFFSGAGMTLHSGILGGTALLVFAYFGFENISALAQEAKTPKKALPRAIFLSLAISSVLYILVALAVTALSSPAELAGSSAPLSDAIRKESPRLANAMGWIALFATGNTALMSLIAASRILYGMSAQGALPSFLSEISKRRKVPWISALFVCGGAAALLLAEGLEVIAGVCSLVTMINFILVNLSLIVLRFRAPNRERPFRAPGRIGRFPVSAGVGIVVLLCLIPHFERDVYLIFVAWIALVALIQLLTRDRSPKAYQPPPELPA